MPGIDPIELQPCATDSSDCDVVNIKLSGVPVTAASWVGMVVPNGDHVGLPISAANIQQFEAYNQIEDLAMITRIRAVSKRPDINSYTSNNLIMRVCVDPPLDTQTVASQLRLCLSGVELELAMFSSSDENDHDISLTASGRYVKIDGLRDQEDLDTVRVYLFRGLGLLFEICQKRDGTYDLADMSRGWQNFQGFCLMVERRFARGQYEEDGQTHTEEVRRIMEDVSDLCNRRAEQKNKQPVVVEGELELALPYVTGHSTLY